MDSQQQKIWSQISNMDKVWRTEVWTTRPKLLPCGHAWGFGRRPKLRWGSTPTPIPIQFILGNELQAKSCSSLDISSPTLQRGWRPERLAATAQGLGVRWAGCSQSQWVGTAALGIIQCQGVTLLTRTGRTRRMSCKTPHSRSSKQLRPALLCCHQGRCGHLPRGAAWEEGACSKRFRGREVTRGSQRE